MLAIKRTAGVTQDVNLQEHTLCMPQPNVNEAGHSGIEIQRKFPSEAQNGYQWPHKRLCFHRRRLFFHRHLSIQLGGGGWTTPKVNPPPPPARVRGQPPPPIQDQRSTPPPNIRELCTGRRYASYWSAFLLLMFIGWSGCSHVYLFVCRMDRV